MTGVAPALSQALAAGEPAVLVTVASALGSTPREAGARMLVQARRTTGTIGGGRLEHEAIAAARRLIETGGPTHHMEVPLGPAIGQCCGGHVTMRLERADTEVLVRIERIEQAELACLPAIYLFGAGHVGKAVAQALAPLPLRLTWIDSRAEEFPDWVPDSITRLVAADPVALVKVAEPGAGFLVLTHDHALDFDLAGAALRRGDAFYVGLIGSRTKRRKFEHLYRTRDGRSADLARLVCPIGAGLSRDKRPPVIAAMVAAELLIAIDRAASRVVPIAIGAAAWDGSGCAGHRDGCGACPDATATSMVRGAV
jgi:xanthine dehydrogenase accessory protein XdhC